MKQGFRRYSTLPALHGEGAEDWKVGKPLKFEMCTQLRDIYSYVRNEPLPGATGSCFTCLKNQEEIVFSGFPNNQMKLKVISLLIKNNQLSQSQGPSGISTYLR